MWGTRDRQRDSHKVGRLQPHAGPLETRQAERPAGEHSTNSLTGLRWTSDSEHHPRVTTEKLRHKKANLPGLGGARM